VAFENYKKDKMQNGAGEVEASELLNDMEKDVSRGDENLEN
jgi:hypothetical protein